MIILNNSKITFDQFKGDKTLLIDADGLVYSSAFACQKSYYEVKDGDDVVETFNCMADLKTKYHKGILPDGLVTVKGTKLESESQAIYSLESQLKSLYRSFNPKEVRLYLQGKNNFRDQVASINKYKAGRSEKPVYLGLIRDHLVKEHKAIIIDNWETDDQLVMDHFEEYERAKNISDDLTDLKMNCNTILMSRDKDLKQCPGWFYNFGSHNNEAEFITELGELYIEERGNGKDKVRFNGLKGLYFQALVGDDVDAIPGIMSEKKAYTALLGDETEEQLYKTVRHEYVKALGNEVIYHPWTELVDPNEIKTKRVLKKGAKRVKVSIDEYLREVMTLLWMLRKPFDKIANIQTWSVPK
jgi:5'-3' exonuclease